MVVNRPLIGSLFNKVPEFPSAWVSKCPGAEVTKYP